MKRTVVFVAAVVAAAPAAAAPPASNQRVLTERQSERIVAYARSMRACLARSGLDVARPRATRKQITIAVTDAASTRAVLDAGMACGTRIGDPPAFASMQAFRDEVVLYVPKQCLIDEDVARRNS
jgi:hypothetical protein